MHGDDDDFLIGFLRKKVAYARRHVKTDLGWREKREAISRQIFYAIQARLEAVRVAALV
jgi:hypothetical protein